MQQKYQIFPSSWGGAYDSLAPLYSVMGGFAPPGYAYRSTGTGILPGPGLRFLPGPGLKKLYGNIFKVPIMRWGASTTNILQYKMCNPSISDIIQG